MTELLSGYRGVAGRYCTALYSCTPDHSSISSRLQFLPSSIVQGILYIQVEIDVYIWHGSGSFVCLSQQQQEVNGTEAKILPILLLPKLLAQTPVLLGRLNDVPHLLKSGTETFLGLGAQKEAMLLKDGASPTVRSFFKCQELPYSR